MKATRRRDISPIHLLATTFLVSLLLFGAAARGARPAVADQRAPRGDRSLMRDTRSQAGDTRHRAGSHFTRTEVDSFYIFGGPGTHEGRFESPAGTPDWHGWTSQDFTRQEDTHWHISTYHAENLNDHGPGNQAMWCGAMIPACPPPDEEGGYGNDWVDYLEFYGAAPDPEAATSVRVTAAANLDTEIAYDFLKLFYEGGTGMYEVAWWEGAALNLPIDETFAVAADDLVGPDEDQIHLRWEFTSDEIWSDEDCSFASVGAVQMDDLTVYFNDEIVAFDDFEGTVTENWRAETGRYVGDFAQIMDDLQELDPCLGNRSPQALFIDDGIIVPGTGGSPCVNWCYGPDSWVVNPNGGLAGYDYKIDNGVFSPPIAWQHPDQLGGMLQFDVYVHGLIDPDSAFVFYGWGVRSVATGNPDDLASADWRSRGWVYYGGPEYRRHDEMVTDLLEPGCTHVQILLFVKQVYSFWWPSDDASPAPYFDNVAFLSFDHHGPAFSSREVDRAQDTFPERGAIDHADPGTSWCRFDMARNIAQPITLRNDPGDSIIFDVAAVRPGSTLDGPPDLVYRMQANSLFDPYRSGFPTEGRVACWPVDGGHWACDLPDTGWFFPGDVIHYYFEGTDELGGVTTTSTMPADTSGYSDFTDALRYDSSYIVRALPTVQGHEPGEQPKILLWNDFANRGGEEKWIWAMTLLGLVEGRDYDLYYTNGPSSAVGNGLGGRATPELLAGYDQLFYTCGDLRDRTLGHGDYYGDPSDDVGLLDAWLRQGGKGALLTGDNLLYDLVHDGPETSAFVDDWLSVTCTGTDVAPLIQNQISPRVAAVPGNTVFSAGRRWLAHAGCPGYTDFDAVEIDACERIAEFLAPDGQGGQYSLAAGTYFHEPTSGSRTVYLPYDLMHIQTAPLAVKDQAPLPDRVGVLEEIYLALGGNPVQPPTDVPAAGTPTVSVYPNPFNPKTRIDYTLPTRERLLLRIYDLRGQLVRTLVDEPVDAGPGHVFWEGTDADGRAVAAGVYFCEARAGDWSRVHKLTLLK